MVIESVCEQFVKQSMKHLELEHTFIANIISMQPMVSLLQRLPGALEGKLGSVRDIFMRHTAVKET